MTLRSFQRFRPLQQGFSLIEMLVAMLFIGVLTAGMLRVYSTNLAGFQRVNDMIGNQRRGRWALGSLQDDVASIGYFAFVPFNVPTGYSVASGTQEPFMILPAPTAVSVTSPDPSNPTSTVTADLSPNPDELQFVGDLPLPIQATVLTSVAGSTILTLNVVSGTLGDIQVGDIAAILDAAFEQVQVASVLDNTITLSATAAAMAGITQAGGYALSPALGFHQAGTPVVFFRPNIVTRYSIQAPAWDPSNATITVPCLVRQQAPYPTGGGLITWANVAGEVVAENIDSFVVDLSFDGGTTWLRQGAASWDAIVALTTPILTARGGKNVPLRDASNPLWFRTFPCLIRMDITSRSAAPRTASTTTAGQAAYVRRTQSLMVAPRNFGLPL